MTGHDEDRMPTHGHEPTREAAMAAFAKSWQREFCVTPEVDQSAGLTRSVAKTDRATEAWYHASIA